jgi:hypothetical protein
MAIWYFRWNLVYFCYIFPFLVYCVKKIWQPWTKLIRHKKTAPTLKKPVNPETRWKGWGWIRVRFACHGSLIIYNLYWSFFQASSIFFAAPDIYFRAYRWERLQLRTGPLINVFNCLPISHSVDAEPGLPDGVCTKKSQIWYRTEGLRMDILYIFFVLFDMCYGHLVNVMGIGMCFDHLVYVFYCHLLDYILVVCYM